MTGVVKPWRAGLAAAVMSLGLATQAKAADDGYENVFSAVLGTIGLIKKDPGPDIAYRERPPLVLPPKIELPKPVSAEDKRVAAWPQDPDVLRQRKAKEEALVPTYLGNNPNTLASKEDLLKGRAGEQDPVRPNDCGVNGNARHCLLMSPDEMQAQSDRFKSLNPDKSEVVAAGQEPGRVYLTQPPKGYLRATQTVKATAEAPVQREDAANPFNWLKPTPKDDE